MVCFSVLVDWEYLFMNETIFRGLLFPIILFGMIVFWPLCFSGVVVLLFSPRESCLSAPDCLSALGSQVLLLSARESFVF